MTITIHRSVNRGALCSAGGQMNGIAFLFLLISCELYSGKKRGAFRGS